MIASRSTCSKKAHSLTVDLVPVPFRIFVISKTSDN